MFDDRRFMFDLYRDWHPLQVGKKCAQIGDTTKGITKTFYAAKQKKIDIVYTLPTDNDVKAFAGGKVNRMVANNPIFQEYVSEKDTVEQKKVGENIIYYRGTKSNSAAIMVSADLLVHDEIDRSDQKVIATYESRLQASDKKWRWVFSNPSVPGNGVSRYWEVSSQDEWFIRCTTCLKEQYLVWPDNFNIEKKMYVCKFCSSELTDRKRGRWVKRFKDREWHGYHISLMMAPWVAAKEIIEYHDTKPADYFCNFVLGEPYIGEGNTVTPETIYQNCTPEVNDQEFSVIGCDSGIVKHYVIGNKKGFFFYDKTEDWDDIGRLLAKNKKWIAVIDAMPDITGPRKLRDEFPGRVFLCHYARDRKTMQLIRWGEGDEAGNVTVDRNRAMQFLIDELAQCRIPIQGNRDDWSEYASHWKTMYRISDVDSNGSPIFKWETSTGVDHFCHASLYSRVGIEKMGTGEVKFALGSGETKEKPVPLMRPDGKVEYTTNPLVFGKKPKTEDFYDI